jgi:hypothetical protein
MKLKELKQLTNKAVSELTFKYEHVNKANATLSQFSGLRLFRKGINTLEKTELFKDEITAIKNSGIFTTSDDAITLQLAEGRQIHQEIENLRKILISLNKTLTSVVGEIKENSISIKLPDTKDFEDLSKTSAIFHTILSQSIINDQINGEVKIENVENGSIWLDIYVGSAAAVTLLGGLGWAGAVIFKKIQEGRIIQEHVKSLEIKNESLQEIQMAQKKALDLMIESEAKHIHSENFTGGNPEQIERLKHSIKLLAEQIDKGAEIHPALNAPESVKNLFPDTKNLIGLESKIKKLN